MRIAISGAHCCGKSTLIDAFLLKHDDYIHEPEAYEALQDLHGETFAAEPSADDFYRQLEYQIVRLQQYNVGDRIIFERSPADYLAYLLALVDLNRETADIELAERSIEMVRDAITLLDIIMFLPAGGSVDDSEDPQLRRVVNRLLENIILNDEYDMFTAKRPMILEASGDTQERLRRLEQVL